MALPLCVTAINFIIPFAFSILATFERYKQPKNELYITMVRCALNFRVPCVSMFDVFSNCRSKMQR